MQVLQVQTTDGVANHRPAEFNLLAPCNYRRCPCWSKLSHMTIRFEPDRLVRKGRFCIPQFNADD